ncbi:gamma carbonic anhydrase family protein [Trichloromonas sp.]|uniref:gamma carbonic anhydrase family protein n=1 Tax=Trichloromonas sp. TaxID=3069249 RepID=UPI003D8199E2
MLLSHRGRLPRVAPTAFVENSAMVIGDVALGDFSSVWFNVVIRGDVNSIRIGARSNIQDGTVVHVTRQTHSTVIGNDVTIGHNVTLHGCEIGDRCLVGMGAVILDGATVGPDAMVAAGAVVTPGTVIPPRTLAMGSPARVRRELTDDEVDRLKQSAANYIEYMQDYR